MRKILQIQGAVEKSPFKEKARDYNNNFKPICPSNAEVNVWPQDFQQKPQPRNLGYG